MNRARRPRVAAPRPHGGVDRGATLIELVIVVMLLGVVIVAILAAVITSIVTSRTARNSARVETVVVNATDRLNRAPKGCDYAAYVQAAVQTEGWPISTASVVQKYYVPGADATTAGTWLAGLTAAPACPPGSSSDLVVQRISVTINSPDGRVNRSIEVLKSDV